MEMARVMEMEREMGDGDGDGDGDRDGDGDGGEDDEINGGHLPSLIIIPVTISKHHYQPASSEPGHLPYVASSFLNRFSNCEAPISVNPSSLAASRCNSQNSFNMAPRVASRRESSGSYRIDDIGAVVMAPLETLSMALETVSVALVADAAVMVLVVVVMMVALVLKLCRPMERDRREKRWRTDMTLMMTRVMGMGMGV